ncbi:hypothetical protein [Pseudomonas alabamensis]|uniref:hypothetical protein n=1 Tax=Pseudomonas alabamensis TaxID=3064349 RepID=UPI003F64F588
MAVFDHANAAGAIEFQYKVFFPESTTKTHTTQVTPWLQKHYLADGDGKTLLVGRVNPQGDPDPGFSSDGLVSEGLDLPNDSSGPPQVSGLIVYASGKIISGLQSPVGLGLACFTQNGELDTDFGVQGKIIHPLDVKSSTASKTIDSNGTSTSTTTSIITTSTSTTSTSTTTSTIATNTGTTSTSTTSTTTNTSTTTTTTTTNTSTSDDKKASVSKAFVPNVLVAGERGAFYVMAGRRSGHAFTLLRCQENGQLDTTFNGSGKVTVKHPNFDTDAMAVVAAPDGGAVVAGKLGPGRGTHVFFSRLNVDGSTDERFGKEGYAMFDAESVGIPAGRLFQIELTSIIRLADGGYAASGDVLAHTPAESCGLLIRLDSHGCLVPTFNEGKPLLFKHPEDHEVSFVFGGLTEQKDGKLVVAGGLSVRTGGYKRSILVVRYTPEGNLDTSWAAKGWETYEPLDHTVCYAQSVVLDENQKILVSGDGGPNDNIGSFTGFVMQLTS